MTKAPHPLWIERPDGRLIPVGHSEPKAAPGHVTLDPVTGRYTQLVRGRHDRLECWPIRVEHLTHFGLRGRPATN